MHRPHRLHLFACAGPRCGAEHGESLKARLVELLPDRKELGIRLSTSSCQGLCSRGPNLSIYPEGWVYHRVELGDLDRIVQEHLRGGCPVQAGLADPLAPADESLRRTGAPGTPPAADPGRE